MYKDQGGECVDVQGLPCYLPPRPHRESILNWELKPSDQRWKRTELPVFKVRDIEIWDGAEYGADDEISWEEAVRQEYIKISGTDLADLDKQGNPKRVYGVEVDIDYSMPCLDAFREQELTRIINGVWVYIKGKPYYFPGCYYFYTCYWQLKDGYPEFRFPDLELFWMWEHVRLSPFHLGLIYITMRGVGKSYIAGCLSYYAAITKKKASTTIQSKSDEDAYKLFYEKILLPMSTLPEFLVPINSHVGDLTKVDRLRFSPPSRKQMNARLYNKMKKSALFSLMEYHNAGQFACDGGTYDLVVQSEIGKTDHKKIANVYDRLMVNMLTVFRGNKKLGNVFAESTVEEMNQFGEPCKKIWDLSDHTKLNANNKTSTGLVRYFRSALRSTFFDSYGFPDEERSKKFHDEERRSLEHDVDGWVKYVQKNPYSATEAFWITGNKCIYNSAILLAAKDKINSSGKRLTRRGNFEWKEIDKEVIWVDNDVNGRWEVSYFPDKDEINKVKINPGIKTTFSPMFGHKRVIGYDPFSVANLVDENRGSNAAITVYQKYAFDTEYCNTFIATYCYRPPSPEEATEDAIKAAFWFSAPILCETNKGDVLYYMKTRGYKWGMPNNDADFVLSRPESTAKPGQKLTDGVYATPGLIEQYSNATAHHIIHHGHKLKFVDLIDAFLRFDPSNTKKYDLAIAGSLAIMAAEKKIDEAPKALDLSNMFKTYNNTGTYSSLN